MRKTFFAVLLIAVCAMNGAFADDLSPGLWEISMETRVPADAGWNPDPFNLTQCLTASDAKDPSKLISSISTPGATGCNYTNKSYSGSTFQFALDCSGSYGLKSKGSVTFSANSFAGDITATGNLGGQVVEFQNHVTGKRVGGC